MHLNYSQESTGMRVEKGWRGWGGGAKLVNCHFKGHQALSKEGAHKDKIKLWGGGQVVSKS